MTVPQATVPVETWTRVRRRGVRFGLLGYSPALDGLRGLAVLIVVWFHFAGHQRFFGRELLAGGWAGVDLFLCLSGFLITALLLDERRMHGRVTLASFWARRACRLLPALLLFLAAWVALLFAFGEHRWFASTPSNEDGRVVETLPALGDVGIALLYGANWNVLAGGMEAPLAHLWSLAVEEQYYLLWPLLLVALLALTARVRLLVVGGLVAVAALLPWAYWDGGAGADRIYFGTDTRAIGLLMGSLAGLIWHRRHAAGRSTHWAAARAWAALGFVLWVVLTGPQGALKFVVVLPLLALAVAQLVPYLAEQRGLLSRAFSLRPLVWLGRRSYALYLWHYVWATWTHQLAFWPGLALGLAGSLACTVLSWRLVEQPALRLGQRWAVRPTLAPEAAPVRAAA